MLCGGISLISCALIIGQVEDNRQLAWQKNKLTTDLEHFQKQIDTNHEFLSRLSTDANLAERLAQRQMKMVREGEAVLDLKGTSTLEDTSPFRLVNIPPPPAVRPYEPASGLLTRLFANARVRLYTYGVGAFAIALAIIAGASDTRPEES